MSDQQPISRRELLRGRFAKGLVTALGGTVADRIEAASNVLESAGNAQPDRAAPSHPQAVTPPIPTDPTPPPGTESTQQQFQLPPLHQSVLDQTTVEQLFRDIKQCTKIIEVVPKFGRGHVDEQRISLEQAAQLLREKKVRAVQLRYLYDGSEWWDTLIPGPDGVKVVRIRHDAGPDSSNSRT